jgi:hypothetical protein
MKFVDNMGPLHTARVQELQQYTPYYIAIWIMKACETKEVSFDELEEDEAKGSGGGGGATYSHALKMRAAISWGFTSRFGCVHQAYASTGTGKWIGNPSLSPHVSKYMISLQRRKVCQYPRYSRTFC